MRPIIIESPYAGDVARNVAYAKRALLDSLTRGESPFAGHLLYTQVLNNKNAEERAKSMDARFGMASAVGAWISQRVRDGGTLPAALCSVAAFYLDYGWTEGMIQARDWYRSRGYLFSERTIGTNE